MLSFKQFVAEANDAYCSDECCGSDVKAEDCPCPADCPHCNCNAIDEACWDTHKQVGMKKKGNKMVPNCVPNEDVDEGLIGNAVGGAFKIAAKTVVGGARLAGKGVKRASVAGRADAAEKKAKKAEQKNKDREKLTKMKARYDAAKAKARERANAPTTGATT